MKDADNIRKVEALGIDWMGFIFWPKSSRYVCERPIYLPQKAKRVGVFVDESIENVRQTADDYALDYIQLHGHESPDYCAQLQSRPIIKAFNIATSDDLSRTKAYEGLVDYFLFDTRSPVRPVCSDVIATPLPGGSGKKFDWNVLMGYNGSTPFLLSGGIGPDDATLIKAFLHPLCIGIDLNSRFETEPGIKQVGKLKEFLKQSKQ